MGSLTKRVFHDCAFPKIADVTSEHRYVCPACRSVWEWSPGVYGYWWAVTRLSEWVQVQP